MADDSLGKVQALAAIFSEKNVPFINTSTSDNFVKKPRISNVKANSSIANFEQEIHVNVLAQSLPTTEKKSEFILQNREARKPLIKSEKPSISLKHSNTKGKEDSFHNIDGTSVKESHICDTEMSAKTDSVGKTIAFFMFENECSVNNFNESTDNNTLSAQKNTNILDECSSVNSVGKENFLKTYSGSLCSTVKSDSYKCKNNMNLKPKSLPSTKSLGNAPEKPLKPLHLKLPIMNCPGEISSINNEKSFFKNSEIDFALQNPLISHSSNLQDPLPPIFSEKNLLQSLRQELDELYVDTVLSNENKSQKFTKEKYEAEELYNDAAVSRPLFSLSNPSEFHKTKLEWINENLYQDALHLEEEKFYEVMPCEIILSNPDSNLYANNKKQIGRFQRAENKKNRKELREKEKISKEVDKLRRKFSLNGGEAPIDEGVVKSDSRGGKGGDLPVKKGETLLILRIEGNPSGKWLVKNEKGKIGYVELTNIEVDPDSVKSVMTIRRISGLDCSEELYSEAKSEEDIYETTA